MSDRVGSVWIPRQADAVRRAWGRVRTATSISVPATLLVVFLLSALVIPVVWHFPPNAADIGAALQAPSAEHPFGTDDLGRDLFARFFAGARLSILIGLVSVMIGGLVGMIVGSIAGMAGGFVDSTIMRTLDAILAFPALILAIGIGMAIGPGLLAPTLAVILNTIPWYARRVRSEVLSIKTRTFFDAERLMGKSLWHKLWHHVFPAVIGGVVVQASLAVGFAVQTVAGTGYVGLGVQAPQSEWGAMISEGQQYLLTGHWWVSVIPGIGVLLLSVLCIKLGDSLSRRFAYAV